jgi:hypothetical protein
MIESLGHGPISELYDVPDSTLTMNPQQQYFLKI